MRILHVIGCLDAGDSAQQLCLLAPALAGHGHTTEIACIGGADRQADELRRQGIAVHRLGWTRWFDVAAIFGLRRLLHDGCWDAVHAWDVPALRASGLIAWNAAPVVISWPSRPKNLRWWDRRIFRRVRRVVVSSEWEHQRCLCEGLSAEWLRFIPPAAPAAQPGVQDVDEAALAFEPTRTA